MEVPSPGKQGLLKALDHINKLEAHTGGQVVDLCVVFALKEPDGEGTAVGYTSSGDSPAYAISGILRMCARMVEDSYLEDDED